MDNNNPNPAVPPQPNPNVSANIPAPAPTPPVVEPAPPKPSGPLGFLKTNKKLMFILGGILLLILIGLGAYLFINKSQLGSFEPLPYQISVTASTPREKFEQTISGNPVFTQIKTNSAPVVAVSDSHNEGAQAMMSVKAALGNVDTSQKSQKQKTLIKIDGTMLEPTSGATQDFNLIASMLGISENSGAKSLMDLIVNGSIGSAKLDDESQDALHVSLTQTDPSNSYLKVNMSDYLLIFIDKLKNPTTSSSSSISFDTNGIWPFLGQYLHIPRSIEEIRFGKELSQEDKGRMKTIRDETTTVFQNTLGNVNSYIDITDSSQDASSTTFTGIIVPAKLAVTISDYFNGLDDVINRHTDDLLALCSSTTSTPEEAKSCQDVFSQPEASGIDTDQLTKFLGLFKFEPIKENIDNSTLAVKSSSFGFSLSNIDSESGLPIPLPFSKLNFSVTSSLADVNIGAIKAPQKSVELLSAGNNTETIADNSYQEKSVQGDAYRENKDLLLSGYSGGRQVCYGEGQDGYCLNAPQIWEDFSSNEDGFNYLSLTKKNADPNDPNTEIITIDQRDQHVSACSYSDAPVNIGIPMDNYKEVTTVDGITMRISDPKKYDNEDGYNYIYVCTQKDGTYFETTPYGNISIDAGSSSFQDILPEIEPILSSLSSNDSGSLSQFTYPTAIPIRTPTYGFSIPMQVYESNGNTFVMFYGATPGDDNSCANLSSFLAQKYDVPTDSAFVTPPGYGLCLKQNTCYVCNNGKVSSGTTDLSKCSGQLCQ